MQKDHPLAALSEYIAEANGRQQPVHTSHAVAKEKNSEPPVSKAADARRMRLPPILVDKAAEEIFEYWERYAARTQGVQPVRWSELAPAYQALWRDIVSSILEMGITVVMKDAVYTLDQSNGDMGGAFAKALKRYMHERLGI